MGESAGRRVDRWRFWVLRFRLMVERGPHSRPQASEGEAQHGPFCRTRRISQGNKYLHRGRHGQDRARSKSGERTRSSAAGAEKPCLSLQSNWTGSRAAVAMALPRACRSGFAQMMRVGLYRPVHVKTLRSQKLRMLLTHRKLLQSKAIAIDNDLRGTL